MQHYDVQVKYELSHRSWAKNFITWFERERCTTERHEEWKNKYYRVAFEGKTRHIFCYEEYGYKIDHERNKPDIEDVRRQIEKFENRPNSTIQKCENHSNNNRYIKTIDMGSRIDVGQGKNNNTRNDDVEPNKHENQGLIIEQALYFFHEWSKGRLFPLYSIQNLNYRYLCYSLTLRETLYSGTIYLTLCLYLTDPTVKLGHSLRKPSSMVMGIFPIKELVSMGSVKWLPPESVN